MITAINNQNNESKNINGTYKSEDGKLYFRDYRKVGRAPGLVYLTNNHLHTTGEVDEADGRYYVELDEGWSLQEGTRTGSAAPHTARTARTARTTGNIVQDLRSNAKTLLSYVTNLDRVKDECQTLQLTSETTDEQMIKCLSLTQLRSVVADSTPEQFRSLLANADRGQLMELAQSGSAYISTWSLWENADIETAKNRLNSLIEAEEDVKKLCDTINGLSNAIYFQTEEAEAQADEAQAEKKPRKNNKKTSGK